MFDEGEWQALIEASHATVPRSRRRPTIVPDSAEDWKQRLEKAEVLVANGELSHAARLIRSNGLAPGDDDTLRQLADTNLRPLDRLRPLPAEVDAYRPDVVVELDRGKFIGNLRRAPRGLSGGLSGHRNEHMKIALEDPAALEHLCQIGQFMAEADMPDDIREVMRLGKLTAIRKNNNKVRGLNAADPFKRLVARTLAQQFASEFRTATMPHNYGLAEHGGTESIVHLLRDLTDTDPNLCITKIDGVGAFDHIYRASMLKKLHELPTAHRLLPFVMSAYGTQSTYFWTDAQGNTHDIRQGEGGEQGDALMPALFSLGIHDALENATRQLQPGERILAYLDDVYIVSVAARARILYDCVSNELLQQAGISVNTGKTECWGRCQGPAPPEIAVLNAPLPAEPVWKNDLPPEFCGIEVLGSPLGTPEFINRILRAKLDEEHKLLDNLEHIPNIQTSWLLLFFCSCPRANYILRTVPPHLCQDYCEQRDETMRNTLAKLVNVPPPSLHSRGICKQIHMPVRHGGLGLSSATRTSPAAYWASWCDTLPTLFARNNDYQNRFLQAMLQHAAGSSSGTCLEALHASAMRLLVEGFTDLPPWQAIIDGVTPPALDPFDEEPDTARKGWQHLATKSRDLINFNLLLAEVPPSSQARLRSCGGPNAGRWLWSIPKEKALRLEDPLFRCALLRRLGLPVESTGDTCEGCGRVLDNSGLHRTTCMRSGRVQVRHKPLILIWRRIFREAGVHLPDRCIERQMRLTHINRGPQDLRRMDLISPGIDGVFGGSPLFMDVTIVSPLHGNGTPMPNSASRDGAANQRAEDRNKNSDYPDVEAAPDAQLLSLGIETYGRHCNQSLVLMRQLARSKSNSYPEHLQKSVEIAYFKRWWGLLSIGVQRIIGDSILRLRGSDLFEAADYAGAPVLERLLDTH